MNRRYPLFHAKTYGILAFFSLLIFFSCADEVVTGRTGEPVSFTADIDEDSDDLDYIWSLVEQPDASIISTAYFKFNENSSTASFVPDKPGEYELMVNVFQYGDELARQSFNVQVEMGDATVPVPPEAPSVPDWYEDEGDSQWLREEVVDVPDVIEVAPVIENVKEVATEDAPPPQPKTIPRGIDIPKNEGRFTIQVVSKKSLEEAEVIAAELIDGGYDAYIQKAYFKETDEVWFRVRVGSYNSRETATTVANNLSKTRGTSTWVDFVRYEE